MRNVLIATAALAALATAAQAQPGGNFDPAALFSGADKNNDKVLTKEEWAAAGRRPETFDRIDADKDGKVTEEQFKAAMASFGGGRPGGPPGGAPAPK